MHPRWPAVSILPPHLRLALGQARLRGCWDGNGLVAALGVREPMPRGMVRRNSVDDLFLAAFHQPARARTTAGTIEAEANTVLAWSPGMVQEYGRDDRVWLHSWLHLRNPEGGMLARLAGLPMGRPMPQADLGHLDGSLIELHAEMAQHHPDGMVVHALCSILLRRLARRSGQAGDGIDEVERRIRADPCAEMKLADLAQLADCSRQHLCRVFLRRFGSTPMALAGQLRLSRAEQMLRDGASPGEAAGVCGWRNRRQFTRMFRQRFGASPTAWVKNIR